jgi:hypothetical protein
VIGAPAYWDSTHAGKVFVIDAGLPGTGVGMSTTASGEDVHLLPSRPNPFQDVTVIRYELPARQQVSVNIYDVGGRLVRILQSGHRGPGIQSVPWNRTNAGGHRVQSGIYFVRLEVGSTAVAQKVVVVE